MLLYIAYLTISLQLIFHDSRTVVDEAVNRDIKQEQHLSVLMFEDRVCFVNISVRTFVGNLGMLKVFTCSNCTQLVVVCI